MFKYKPLAGEASSLRYQLILIFFFSKKVNIVYSYRTTHKVQHYSNQLAPTIKITTAMPFPRPPSLTTLCWAAALTMLGLQLTNRINMSPVVPLLAWPMMLLVR